MSTATENRPVLLQDDHPPADTTAANGP